MLICQKARGNGVVFEPSASGADSLLTGGVETGGPARGPAFQLFDIAGSLQLGRFALNPDFRGCQVFS